MGKLESGLMTDQTDPSGRSHVGTDMQAALINEGVRMEGRSGTNQPITYALQKQYSLTQRQQQTTSLGLIWIYGLC